MRSSSGEYLLRSASKKQGSIGRAGKATWPPGAAGAAAALEDAAIQSVGGTQTGAQRTQCVAFFVIFRLSLFFSQSEELEKLQKIQNTRVLYRAGTVGREVERLEPGTLGQKGTR